ncbi:unnamed protein product [Heligmosomoides polygyrus]|uniref:Uncharacterized protein n=1 Tax=Heligmosomoides polygyrus TaxID=6339 RepID=A0A3P7ZF61_HELPZ|nr:unnamed protein product [Heligmosomoides polygyrus]
MILHSPAFSSYSEKDFFCFLLKDGVIFTPQKERHQTAEERYKEGRNEVRYPNVDNFDLFNDEDNSQPSQPLLSQSSQSSLLQSSFGAPITPTLARKTFISCKMGDVRPDVEEGKRIAQTLSSVQQSSDLIVRQLMNVIADQSNMIVGLTAAVDSCMARLTQLQKQLTEAVSSVVKKSPEAKLPEETCLAFENLTQLSRIPQLAVLWLDLSNAIFKSVDLNKKMEKWIRTKRGKPDDHVTECTDFFRVYLKEACEPPTLVKRYAVRISDPCTKRSDLRDFPEELVEQLIVLAFAGRHRLRKGGRVRGAEKGESSLDGSRQRNDIRKYVLDANGRLVPAPKVKIIRIGSQPSTSQRTPQDDDEEDDDTAWRKD